MKCTIYHADLSLSERTQAQKDFADDKASIMVATVAFGMGINKPGNNVFLFYYSIFYFYFFVAYISLFHCFVHILMLQMCE